MNTLVRIASCALATALALASLASLALSATSAYAAPAYPFSFSFGQGILTHPNGLGIDQSTGELYVSDYSSNRVYKFDSSGALVPGFGSAGQIDGSTTPAGSFNGAAQVAVDNSAGSAHDIYVADVYHSVVDKFNSSGNYICQISGAGNATASPSECDPSDPTPAGSGPLIWPGGVAVDNAGNVYIGDVFTSKVDVFDPTGRFLRSFPTQPGDDDGDPSGPSSIAVDSAGNLYTAISDLPSDENHGGGAHVYTSAGAPNTTIGCPASDPSDGIHWMEGPCPRYYQDATSYGLRGPGALKNPTGNPNSVAIDPADNEIFVGDNTGVGTPGLIDLYDSAGNQLERFGEDASPPLSWQLTALGVNGASGQVYVGDWNQGLIEVFGPPLARPEPTTSPATDLTQTTATLNGTVNSQGAQLSDCHFDYGPTTTYTGPGSGTAPCVPSADSIPPDSTDHAVSATLGALAPNRAYHFFLSVKTTDHVLVNGADQTFATLPDPPTATTEPVSGIAVHTATLNAEVDPEGAPTDPAHGGPAGSECTIEWGPAIGQYTTGSAPCSPDPSGASADVAVSAKATGLTPSTPYHYTVVVRTAGGETTGADATAETLPSEHFALTVTREGSGSGAVTSAQPGANSLPIDCGSRCEETFPEGDVVTLTATAGANSTFSGWGGACSGTGTCEVAMSEARALTAIFSQDRPAISAEQAGAISAHAATLEGQVDPEGATTGCQFEYGTTTAYGNALPCDTAPGAGTVPVAISATLSGLVPSTVYHYRLEATNRGGASMGVDRTFATAPETCATDTALCAPVLIPPTPSASTPAPSASPGPLRCRKGFHRRRVRGKARCLKPNRHHGKVHHR